MVLSYDPTRSSAAIDFVESPVCLDFDIVNTLNERRRCGLFDASGWSASTRGRLALGGCSEVPLGEVEEGGPVGGDGGVAAAVVVEGEGAGGNRLIEGRQLGSAEVGLAEEFVDGAGGGEGEELAFGVAPLIAQAAVDVNGPRGAKRDQHVLIDGQLVPLANPLLQVAGELVAKVLGHVVQRLAPVAADQRRAHLARHHGEYCRHPLIAGRCPNHRLAQPRSAGDRDLLGIDRLIGLEIVDRPADAPGPGADRAPLVRRGLRLAFLERQADDALRPLLRAVGLNIGVAERRIAPAAAEDLADRIEDRAWRFGFGWNGFARPASASATE